LKLSPETTSSLIDKCLEARAISFVSIVQVSASAAAKRSLAGARIAGRWEQQATPRAAASAIQPPAIALKRHRKSHRVVQLTFSFAMALVGKFLPL
jgi:hypothetical protein